MIPCSLQTPLWGADLLSLWKPQLFYNYAWSKGQDSRMVRKLDIWSQTAWIIIPDLPFIGPTIYNCHDSVSLVYRGDDSSVAAPSSACLRKSNELIYAKCLEWCQKYAKLSINVSQHYCCCYSAVVESKVLELPASQFILKNGWKKIFL